jgi:hypothetical protein
LLKLKWVFHLNFIVRHAAQDVGHSFNQPVGCGRLQLKIVHRAKEQTNGKFRLTAIGIALKIVEIQTNDNQFFF